MKCMYVSKYWHLQIEQGHSVVGSGGQSRASLSLSVGGELRAIMGGMLGSGYYISCEVAAGALS